MNIVEKTIIRNHHDARKVQQENAVRSSITYESELSNTDIECVICGKDY